MKKKLRNEKKSVDAATNAFDKSSGISYFGLYSSCLFKQFLIVSITNTRCGFCDFDVLFKKLKPLLKISVGSYLPINNKDAVI
jgi:hypothetical protein